MSRFVAFALLVCAAFAWVPPLIDRPGLAALGLAFAALALSPGVSRAWRPARMNLPPKQAEVRDEPKTELETLLDRIGVYSDA